MRAGFITTSRRAGKREEKIREQSDHAENSPAFWGYIRSRPLEWCIDGHSVISF
ncbi:hypothetical protein ABZ023_09850 [Streptomyces sp. NPDC006367]|uniref:hypothetical protein n=1 Tax=unclassified Streptomyces TaxID=2593676 RepID=UPI0033AC58CC